jgi:hypothetical protein
MSSWKATLLLVGVLLVAAPAFAQCDDSGPNCGPGSFYDPSNNFYSPYNNLFPPSSVTYYLPSSGTSDQPGETVAVNDGEYVPSVMMNYEDAVALGARQLERQHASEATPLSLADAARQALPQGTPNGSAAVFARQNEAGQLQVCSPRGTNCQPLR